MKIMIKILLIFLLFLGGCSDSKYSKYSIEWRERLQSLPESTFAMVGVVSLGNKEHTYYFVQKCDDKGNQKWLKYLPEKETWIQTRYVTHGCL